MDLRQPGVVTKEVVSTSFSFYDAEEARRISVKRISNPVLFDALNNPVPDGLYDPALGPIDSHSSCATCRLGAMHCPGHFGHIELAVPVYNPLTFGTVVRLLRSMCLHCGHFKMAKDRVAAYARKLELIRAGDLEAAAAVSLGGVSKAVREELNELAQEVGDIDLVDTTHVSRVLPVANRGRPEDRQRWTAHSMAESRDLLKAFLAGVPVKCENCGCASPKINPEGANKIYRQGLTGKQRETNAGLGIDLETELADLATADGEGEDGAELVGQEVEPDAALARKKRKKKRGDGSEDGSGSESDSGSDSGSGSDSEDDDGSGSDDDDDEKKKKKASSSTGASGAGATARAGRQVYVTPIEARALLKKLWSAEYDFCSMVWVANAPAFRTPSRAGAPRRPSDEATPRGSSCRRYW